jgi:hypothetical protein
MAISRTTDEPQGEALLDYLMLFHAMSSEVGSRLSTGPVTSHPAHGVDDTESRQHSQADEGRNVVPVV